MKTDKCDEIKLMQYYDHELDASEMVQMEKHLNICPDCKVRLHRLEEVSQIFNNGFKVDFAHEQRLLTPRFNKIKDTPTPFWERIADFFRIRRVFIPAFAMAALLMIIFSYDEGGRYQPEPTGPSAIIRSFSGNVATVMFLETLENQQTIIWYQE